MRSLIIRLASPRGAPHRLVNCNNSFTVLLFSTNLSTLLRPSFFMDLFSFLVFYAPLDVYYRNAFSILLFHFTSSLTIVFIPNGHPLPTLNSRSLIPISPSVATVHAILLKTKLNSWRRNELTFNVFLSVPSE
jgi:hypothetical protein